MCHTPNMDRGAPPADETLAELLMTVARRMRHRWRAADLAGPSPHEARALGIVVRRDGVRPGALAERLRISPRSATDVVDALEARGLVCRAPDPADRRACLVRVTDAGQDAYAEVARRRTLVADEMLAVLTPPERRAVEDALRRVLQAEGL